MTFVIDKTRARADGTHHIFYDVRGAAKETSAKEIEDDLRSHLEKIYGEFDGRVIAAYNFDEGRWFAVWSYRSIAGR